MGTTDQGRYAVWVQVEGPGFSLNIDEGKHRITVLLEGPLVWRRLGVIYFQEGQHTFDFISQEDTKLHTLIITKDTKFNPTHKEVK